MPADDERKRGSHTVALVSAALACVLALPAVAGAATITVNTTADDGGPGDCELREAVAAANTNMAVSACTAGSGPSDTIVVPAGTYELDAVSFGTLTVSSEITVDGAGPAATKLTLVPPGVGRILEVDPAAGLDLREVTVSGATLADDGAGIRNEGELTVRDSVVADNHAFGSDGGGIHATTTATSTAILSSVIGSPDGGATPGNVADENGGGVFLEGGSLTVRDSLVADNLADNVSMAGNGGGGGGIEVFTISALTVTIEDSAFVDNDGERGAGARLGSAGTIAIAGTTFAGNTAAVAGGGAMLVGAGTVNVLNSTFSANDSPGNGGALYVASGAVNITHVTLADSDSPVGAALRQIGGTVNLKSSLLGSATGDDECSLTGGTFNSLGYNVAEDTSCGLASAGDAEPVSPGVLGLADNGGPTDTHALQSTSPALDRAPCGGVTKDQRGVPRPFGADCDSGAYERMTSCAGLVGKDLIMGTSAGQTLSGTADSEVILGLGGNDVISGGAGNDEVCAGTGNDSVNGGPGDDLLSGEAGTDTASFAGGAKVNVDLASGTATGQGSDTLASFESLTGTSFADTLLGNGLRNVIAALAGADRVVARAGNDLVKGGGGPDRVLGGGGRDRLLGGGGRDLLNGGSGRSDLCNGGGGRDARIARGCERRRGIP
jgi:CSLREA domain-containing protein